MRQFFSGLPGPDLRREKMWEQVLAEWRRAVIERRKRDQRRRQYSAPLTDEVKRATDRMIGERDE